MLVRKVQRMRMAQVRLFSKNDEFNPFSVGLDKEKGTQNQSTVSKLMSFFGKKKGLIGTKSQEIDPKKGSKSTETVNDKYQEKLKEENKKLDEKAEPEIQKQILSLIESNINRKHFNEKKIGAFFEKCWQLNDPKAFKSNDRFFRFLYDDFKVIIQCIDQPKSIVEFVKFIVFFGVDDDPEIFDLLTDAILIKLRYVNIDDLLTIVVNFAHTLHPNAQTIFDAANQEVGQRIRNEYSAPTPDLFLQAEDIVKVLNVFLKHKQLHGELKEAIINLIDSNRSDYTYEILAELSVIYATQMDSKYQEMFFEKFMNKFLKDINFLKEDTLYKILWSFVKAGRLTVKEDVYEWMQMRQAIRKRAKDLSPKIMTNILVLSTVAKKTEVLDENKMDFWDSMEPELILKLRDTELEDLINLMWSAIEIEKGSKMFYEELEKEVTKRILRVKDEEFQTLLLCFSNDKHSVNFSDRFMQIILKVIDDKKDRFQLRTLVHIIWSLAKIDFSSSERVLKVLQDLKDYPRLVGGLEGMYQKSQCILLWTYSRHEALLDQDFLTKVIDSMLTYQGQVFQLDNFDLLLIIQAANHLERSSEVQNNPIFLTKIMQLTQMIDTFVLKNLHQMNLHEFTTMVIYYFNHSDVCSPQLRRSLLHKINESVIELNEYQLHIFKKLCLSQKYSEFADQPLINLVDEIILKIEQEISEVQKAKIMLEAEDKIRAEIRRRLQQTMDLKNKEKEVKKVFKLSGTEADKRLQEDVRQKLRKKEPEEKTQSKQEEPEVQAEEVKEEAKQQGSDLLKRYLKNKKK